jgi:hypothetical protein
MSWEGKLMWFSRFCAIVLIMLITSVAYAQQIVGGVDASAQITGISNLWLLANISYGHFLRSH